MVVITQLHPIAIIFTLPEDQLQEVRQRCAKVRLRWTSTVGTTRPNSRPGKLLTIDNEIDQTTGTAKFKAIFENPDNILWPNQFVNVHLLLETRKDAITAAGERGAAWSAGNFYIRGG